MNNEEKKYKIKDIEKYNEYSQIIEEAEQYKIKNAKAVGALMLSTLYFFVRFLTSGQPGMLIMLAASAAVSIFSVIDHKVIQEKKLQDIKNKREELIDRSLEEENMDVRRGR